jgi:archaemetzincin
MPERANRWALTLSVPFLVAGLSAQFVRPSAARRAAALGSLDGVPAPMRRALDARGFQPVKMPGALDWLANYEEPGQTVGEYLGSRPNLPDNRRKRIYLMPLGDIERGGGPPAAVLARFCAAYFGLEAAVLPSLDLRRARITRRRGPGTDAGQILTADVLALLKARLPADAYALVAVTMEDLYPAPNWNYVFGQASLRDRVAVYSFARYDPRRYGDTRADWSRILLRRSCHILAHETGHMFGIAHCIWYRCVMNGSNHLAEFDGQPLHLCPVDLRKLQWSVGFDAAKRYRGLLAFYEEAGFTDEAEWMRSRLRTIAEGFNARGRPGK